MYQKLRVIRIATWLAALAVILVVSGYVGWRAVNSSSSPTAKQGGSTLIKSAFELLDHHGNSVTEREFKGRWQLVFFRLHLLS
jgi:protein SCO1/2